MEGVARMRLARRNQGAVARLELALRRARRNAEFGRNPRAPHGLWAARGDLLRWRSCAEGLLLRASRALHLTPRRPQRGPFDYSDGLLAMALVLIVEDEQLLRWALQKQLEKAGHQVQAAPDLASAASQLTTHQPDVVLLDLGLPDGHGLDFYESNRARLSESVVIVMTALGHVEEAVRAMKLGALDFLTKPVDKAELVALVDRSLSVRDERLEAQAARQWRARTLAQQVIGESPAFRRVLELVEQVSASDVGSILIQGRAAPGRTSSRGASTPSRRGASDPSSRSPARRSPRRFSRASSSDTRRGRSRTPRCSSAASSSSRKGGRSSSTRSASCASTCRRSSFTSSGTPLPEGRE